MPQSLTYISSMEITYLDNKSGVGGGSSGGEGGGAIYIMRGREMEMEPYTS